MTTAAMTLSTPETQFLPLGCACMHSFPHGQRFTCGSCGLEIVLSQTAQHSLPACDDVAEAPEESTAELDAPIFLAASRSVSTPLPDPAASLRGGGGGNETPCAFPSSNFDAPNAVCIASTSSGDASESLEMLVTSGEPSAFPSGCPSASPSTDSHEACSDIG
eukprot:3936653-Rhodomonas_salina.1